MTTPTEKETPDPKAEGSRREETTPSGGGDNFQRELHQWVTGYRAAQPLQTWVRLNRRECE